MDRSSPYDPGPLQREAEKALMGLANVKGVDADVEANGGVVKVLVGRKLAEAEVPPSEVIPKHFKGYPTDVLEIGETTIQ